MALRDYMAQDGVHAGRSSPLSGGIDSALALAIAVEALGPDGVRGLQHAVALQHRDDEIDRGAARRRARRPLRRHPDPRDRRDRRPHLRDARPSDRPRLHAREPAGAHPRAADDGGVERHRRAADLVRQRDRDRARLRHALRRHVRRHVAHRRPVEGRRLSPRPPRQRASRRRDDPGGDLHASSPPPSSPPISSTRSITRSSRRSSARSSSGASAAPTCSPSSRRAGSTRPPSCRTPTDARSTTSTPRTRSAP